MPILPNSNLALVDQMMRDHLGNGPVALAAKIHLDGGGTRVRAKLALDAAAALGLRQAAATSCACAVELLHNASLVHDDLQERDETRRGRPALWRRFDAATAICAGDLMISAAFGSLSAHPDPARALTIMHEAIAETARGQINDLATRVASLDGYRALVGAKTGPLLALPVRLALCAAHVPGDEMVVDVGLKLSLAYQALDDLRDVDADRAACRVNICLLLESSGLAESRARMIARNEAYDSLVTVRRLALGLPNTVGTAFCNLADRLDSALTEFSDAA